MTPATLDTIVLHPWRSGDSSVAPQRSLWSNSDLLKAPQAQGLVTPAYRNVHQKSDSNWNEKHNTPYFTWWGWEMWETGLTGRTAPESTETPSLFLTSHLHESMKGLATFQPRDDGSWVQRTVLPPPQWVLLSLSSQEGHIPLLPPGRVGLNLGFRVEVTSSVSSHKGIETSFGDLSLCPVHPCKMARRDFSL